MNPKASCVLIFNDDGQVVMVNRRHKETTMSMPGGKVDPGETMDIAACRETFEETGITLNPEDLVFIHQSTCEGDVDYDVNFYITKSPVNKIPGSNESDIVARYGSLKELLDTDFCDYNKRAFADLAKHWDGLVKNKTIIFPFDFLDILDESLGSILPHP